MELLFYATNLRISNFLHIIFSAICEGRRGSFWFTLLAAQNEKTGTASNGFLDTINKRYNKRTEEDSGFYDVINNITKNTVIKWIGKINISSMNDEIMSTNFPHDSFDLLSKIKSIFDNYN